MVSDGHTRHQGSSWSPAQDHMGAWTEPRTFSPAQPSAPPRVAVYLAAAIKHQLPKCFLAAAMHALRADLLEPMLVLVDDSVQADAATLLQGRADMQVTIVPHESTASMLEVHLLNATRVVWTDPRIAVPRFAHGKLREMVWTWCATPYASIGVCQTPLPTSRRTAEFEVQMRAHQLSDRRSGESKHECREHAVRSSWTHGDWIDYALPTTAHSEPTKAHHPRGEWLLDDACLAYAPNTAEGRLGVDRFGLLIKAHRHTRRLLWPQPWPDLYAEYTPGYARLDSERTAPGHSIAAWVTARLGGAREQPDARCRWHNDTVAFVSELSMDNLFHSFIHAIPTYEYFARLKASLRSKGQLNPHRLHLLPHYLMYWPHEVYGEKAHGHGQSEEEHVPAFVGWQIIARSLGVSNDDWPAVAARARKLSVSDQCNCYQRIYGGHGAFMPPPYTPVAEATVRAQSFRHSLVTSFRRAPLPALVAQPLSRHSRILFQLRRNGARHIVNEDAFRASVEAHDALKGRIHFAVMEALPLMEQFSLVQQSEALAGVHGMGLAWTLLLPSDSRKRSSCLEITGAWPSFRRNDYYMLSQANGVAYLRMQQQSSPECICYGCHYRVCGNITVNATQVAVVLERMVRRLDAPPSLAAIRAETALPQPRGCRGVEPGSAEVVCPRRILDRVLRARGN